MACFPRSGISASVQPSSRSGGGESPHSPNGLGGGGDAIRRDPHEFSEECRPGGGAEGAVGDDRPGEPARIRPLRPRGGPYGSGGGGPPGGGPRGGGLVG